MFNEFEQEQNALLEKLVFEGIYPKLVKQQRHIILDGVNEQSFLLELFLTPTCNKHCTYCYLQEHKNDLYPPEFNDFKLIKKNLRILLNSFIERGYTHLNRIDIFSGDIWHIDFGYEILDIILEYIKSGFKIDNFIIPTNGSFLYNDAYYQKMKNYFEAFQHYHCNFLLSFSYDGKIVELDNRPFNNNKQNELSQDILTTRLYEFHHLYNCGFHPMVYAETMEKQIENFNWWTEFLKNEDVYEHVMFLEVRNNNWSDEKIIEYLKWLKYTIEYQYHFLQTTEKNFSLENFLKMCFGFGDITTIKSYNYLPYRLSSNRNASCGLTQGICIRLGDLGICPCHRTAYNKLMIGNFIVENNKIVGIKANNPVIAINIWMNGDNSWLKCDACAFKEFCIKGCWGSQFETHREPKYPAPSACEHGYAKQLFLILNYLKLINQNNLTELISWKNNLLIALNNAKQQDSRRFLKWEKIISKMMLNL